MDQNSRILYVDLFPLDTTIEDVKGLFSIIGKVKHINMPTFYHEHPLNKGHSRPRSKGYAFVEYYSTEDAKKACDFFNDLDNMLATVQHPSKEDDSERLATPEDSKSKFLSNPRYILLMPLRVMLKSTYHDLVSEYKEHRFQSLMRVVKALAIV